MLRLNGLLLLLQYCYLFICFFHFISFLFSFLLLFITTQIKYSQCCIKLKWFTYLACSFISNFVPCSFVSFILFLSLFHFYYYSSPHRLSTVIVLLTFNDSLILLAPLTPIWLPVRLFISFSFPSLFHLYSYSSPSRYSLVNVVLTFNDSLILLAPSTPILLPVHLFISFSFPKFVLYSY